MSVSTGTIIESVKSTFRKVKFLRFGNNDTNNAYQTADFGSDFVAPKGWTVIYAKTMNDAEPVIIGFVNKLSQELGVGERVLFSTDEAGENVKSKITQKNDGNIKIENDNGSVEIDTDGNISVNAKDVNIEATNATIKADTVINGSLTVDGSVTPNGAGGFCGLSTCLFSGAVHVGNKIQ